MNTARQLVVDVPRAPATRFLKPSSSVPGLTSSNSVAAMAIVKTNLLLRRARPGAPEVPGHLFNQTVAYSRPSEPRPKQR